MLATKPHESALCGTLADGQWAVNRYLPQKINEINELERPQTFNFEKFPVQNERLGDLTESCLSREWLALKAGVPTSAQLRARAIRARRHETKAQAGDPKTGELSKLYRGETR